MKLIRMIVCICALAVVGIAVADSITGNLRVSPNLTHTGTGSASTLSETKDTFQSWVIAGTTNAVSLTKMWVASVTLAGLAGTNFDLYASMNDSFGQPVSFSVVKMIALNAATSNETFIGLGGAGSNPMTNWVADASDIIKIAPSAGFYIFAPDETGYAVSNGVADTLAVTNYSTNAVWFDIFIAGTE